ncbi:MAG: aminotransferase class V-fold PLP-dependent enzyme [Actinobacteria bacterium]|nr:aminotransferase class V-fold PLP-dependent enzyme [Actinomycetota bacterium]
MAHHITNFTSQAPLHPVAREALLGAFDQGWADPDKLSYQSSTARILRDESVGTIASHLKIAPHHLEFIADPALGNFYAIAGLLKPSTLLIHSAIDRSEVMAIAHDRKSMQLTVGSNGEINCDSLEPDLPHDSLLALQVANGETGVTQQCDRIIDLLPTSKIACDFSSAGLRVPLPHRWDSAFFDAKSWQGPEGVGIIAIAADDQWHNPLPHIGPQRTTSSVSLPLLMATAVAIDSWVSDEVSESQRLRALSSFLRSEIHAGIPDCDIAGDLDSSLPHINSFSFLYVNGEELLRLLDRAGFAVDSGSACSAQNLTPSHVLAAMGLLTHGNVRITLHHDTQHDDVVALVAALKSAVSEIRST